MYMGSPLSMNFGKWENLFYVKLVLSWNQIDLGRFSAGIQYLEFPSKWVSGGPKLVQVGALWNRFCTKIYAKSYAKIWKRAYWKNLILFITKWLVSGYILFTLMSLISTHARLFFLGSLCHPARTYFSLHIYKFEGNYPTCTFIKACSFCDSSTCPE